jgi:glycerophosphoryl diester phosphodiesterase
VNSRIVHALAAALAILGPAVASHAQHLARAPRQGGVYVVAHRGAHAAGIPENTLAAYREAIALGCDYVEIDLRTSKDGRLVSVHNATVDAYTADATGPVRDLTLAELKALDIGSRVHPKWKDERIPTLEEILDLCQGKVGIYLDLKQADPKQVIPLLRAAGMAEDTLWYAGPPALDTVRAQCPECVIMPDPGPERNLARTLARWQPRVVASTWKHFSQTFLAACRAAGAIVLVDESDPGCWPEALAWGVDGIQTDHPAELIAHLKARGAPSAAP